MEESERQARELRDAALAAGRVNDWIAETLILADWLEEHDRPEDAAGLRLAAQDTPPRPTNWPCVESLEQLTPHQREQLAVALRRPLGILAGSPGTGKTTTLAALVKSLPAHRTAVAAPTGKAAARIAEALREAGCVGIGASTIHQLLGIGRNGHDGRGWGFIYNRTHPLPYKYLIVDEVPMLSTQLAASLLAACKKGTHVLLVGDVDQLPPVGHGSPLRDWMGTGVVPVGRLTEVHRNAGAIARACQWIREGGADEAVACAGRSPGVHDVGDGIRLISTGLGISPSVNWQHVEARSTVEVRTALGRILPHLQAGGGGLMPSVQILAPLREKGDLSCAAINGLCQTTLNPGEAAREVRAWGTRVRPGDRVVCLHNHNAMAEDGTRRYFLANGECGTVTTTQGGHGGGLVGRFESPERDLRLARGDDADFALGYCMTVHKYQGSEIPICIILLDDSWGAKQVVGREWIYTAISRARSLCITIGQLGLVRQAVGSPKLASRKTFLAEAINEEVRRVTQQQAAG